MPALLSVRWTNHVLGLALAGALAAFPACAHPGTPPALDAKQSAAVADGARAFLVQVADGVTRRGPLAWLDFFADTPEFFMAIEGQLAFPDGRAAERGIKELPGKIAQIELRWVEPIRVDPLTPSLAMLAAGWHEILVDPAGHKVKQGGYFTGLAELGPSGWKFRNTHWSLTTSLSPGP